MDFIHLAASSPFLILLSMLSLPLRTRYVCNCCIQNLFRRHASTGVDLPKPSSSRTTRRNNGVTWEGARFRKVKTEESELKATWSTPNIVVTKKPRLVSTGAPIPRILPSYTDTPSLEKLRAPEHTIGGGPDVETQRPVGRIRAGRARIPGPKAAAYLKSKEPSSQELMPSAPSAPLGSQRKDEMKPVEVRLVQGTDKKSAVSVYDHFNWYWETLPPTYNQTIRADHFFLKNRNPPKLLKSIARFMEVPESDVPEVAFVGRSNVGKSSLLNAIVDANVKDLLARTSATRGFTKTMNFYGIGPETGVNLKKDKNGRDRITGSGLVLVDMPGYGDGSLLSWGIEIMKYIQARKQLRRVFVLLDAEHGIKDKDRSLLASLRLAGVSHQVILSKMDKLYIPQSKHVVQYQNKRGTKLRPKGTVEALRKKMEGLKSDINPPVGGGALGEILACSSETLVDSKRLGLDHVRYAVLKAAGLEKGRMKK
jgi:GTP-binding protein